MGAAGLIVQQAIYQMNMSLAMIKQNAQSQQSLVNMIAQSAEQAPHPSGRGSSVNLVT